MSADSRTRMVQSAALLLRERGLSGTSFRDVIEHSGAPRGSIYHHFPEGKRQLVREAVEMSGGWVGDAIASLEESGDPVETLRAFLGVWAEILRASEFRAGCPVVAVSVEANDDEPEVTEAAAAAFRRWTRELADGLHGAGVEEERARRLATTTVAAIEGAVVLCRAERSTGPLDDVGAELEASLRSALVAV
ncbi:TetR/AcrR family transcriptional regulator [Svornostia abyssi]|uniref:TetR/AcrR family transcriptional regulator n=1 Tax=Svornostia abyssi TaxID=2898438 RepID=A0ABY5PFF7_9ACTN|nr:TetR/AcrR family transcriptional regulator [Parviterribacteraceae bacterium J379]